MSLLKRWTNKTFLRSLIPSLDVDEKKSDAAYKELIGGYTDNAKSMRCWDIRFEQLGDAATLNDGTNVLFNRGPLWEGLFVLDLATGYLYTFFRDDRFKRVLQSSKFSSHYLGSLLISNSELDGIGEHQLELLEDDSKRKARIKDRNNLLKQYVDKINLVIPITFTLEKRKIVKVDEYLLNSYGDIIEVSDISDLLSSEVSQIEINNATQENSKSVVRLKEKLQRRVDDEIGKVPKLKQNIKKSQDKRDNKK